jgi:glycosyltransferase involved in cell wall biosynthesis
MRVAHILRKYNPSEWGGTESAVLQLTTDLELRGVSSIVYAPRLGAPTAEGDPFAAAGCAVRPFRAFAPVWGMSQERKRQMISVGGNLVSFDLLTSLWREPRLDVIHSHAQGRLGAAGRAIARARRIPFVLSIHGGVYDLPAKVSRDLDTRDGGGFDWGRAVGFALGSRRLVGQADAIVALNSREADLIREHHPGRRVLIEQHGISTAIFVRDQRSAALAAYPVLEGREALLVLGRIDPTKNQDWLAAEAVELARRHPGVLLVFVGSITNQEYGDAFKARILREGLAPFVMLVGSLPFGDPRLVGLLQLARAVVLPSLSETFGLVILEAWAAGTPVISSRTSGAAALVEEGVNGLLFDLDRPAAFHAAVDAVVERPEWAEALGAAGRAKAVEKFDTSARSIRMKSLYEELIEEKNALRHN